MREIRSYGSVGERGGNEPLYPEVVYDLGLIRNIYICCKFHLYYEVPHFPVSTTFH